MAPGAPKLIQDEIARQVTDALRLRLSSGQQEQVTKRYTENPEAYRLYLQGRYYFNDVPFLGLWGPKYVPISRDYSHFLEDCAAGTLPAPTRTSRSGPSQPER